MKKRAPWGCKRIQLKIDFSTIPPGMPASLAMDKVEKKICNCFGKVILSENSFHEITEDEISFFGPDEILGAISKLLKRNSIKLMKISTDEYVKF